MLSKVSTFFGPKGFFSTGGGTPSLVLSLDAAGYTSSGTWSDLTNFNNDAVSNGLVSWSSEGGGSFNFDGSSANFTFPIVTGLPLENSEYTIETWFKSDSYGNGCNITVGVSSPVVSSWIDNLNDPGGLGYYLAVGIWDGVDWIAIEKMALTGTLVTQDIIDFFDPIQDVTCTLNMDTSQLDFTWYETVNCGFTYTLKIAIVGALNNVLSSEGEGDPNTCDCSEQGSLVSWGSLYTPNYSNVLRLNDNGFYNYWWDNDISVSFSGSQSLYLDNWHYVVATYDGIYRRLYLNGNQVAIDTPLTNPSVNDMSTLRIGYDGLNYFSGKISKVKIHTKALSSSRILSNFNADKVRHGVILGSMTFSSLAKSYLSSSSVDYVFGTNDFTIEAFIKMQLSTDAYGGVVSLRPNGQSYISINTVLTDTSSPKIEFFAAGFYYSVTASNDEWYHTAISRVSGTTSFYVNGDLFVEIPDTTNYNAYNTLVIGRYYTDYDDYYMNGLISNVRIISGVGIYNTASVSIPNTPLPSTDETKLLIISQQTTPTLDVSGNLQSVTSSNIGWTNSTPSFYKYYYPNFADTTGLNLYNYSAIVNNFIYLTSLDANFVGNIYSSDAVQYNRDFHLEFNFECKNGSGADGFCVQWTTSNSQGGSNGGFVGTYQNVSTINAFLFQTYVNNRIVLRQNNVEITFQNNVFTFRQNIYYWMDYNYSTSTMYISYATINSKPVSPQHTFTSVTFDSGNYYLGFGAANGGSNDNHILKSMSLSFV